MRTLQIPLQPTPQLRRALARRHIPPAGAGALRRLGANIHALAHAAGQHVRHVDGLVIARVVHAADAQEPLVRADRAVERVGRLRAEGVGAGGCGW